MSLHAALDVSHTPNGRPIPSLPVVAEWLRSTCGVLREFYFHWHFHWHCLLWVLQLVVFWQLKVGGEGRNRTATSVQAPNPPLGNQRLTALISSTIAGKKLEIKSYFL